ncbi:hypothetical protein OAS86_05985, partial [Gammaproteobacteria bacterium]|nr:hypothetical protein [Gammaproteobacteria bacterium]
MIERTEKPDPDASQGRQHPGRDRSRALGVVLIATLAGLLIAAMYRVLAWWLLPEFFGSIDHHELLQVMRVGSRFDLAVNAALLFPGLLLALWPSARPRRRLRALALALLTLGLLWMAVLLSLDFVHLARGGAHAAQTILETVADGNWGDSEGVVRGASVALLLLSLIILGLMALLIWPLMLRLAGRWWYLPTMMVLLVIAVRGGLSSKPLHTVNAFDAIGARGAELTLSGAYLSVRAMVTESGILRDVQVVAPQPMSEGDGTPVCRVVTRYPRSTERSPNVVLLMLDGWRADDLDGQSPLASRSLEQLRGAQHFEHTYGVGPDRLDGLMAALTGLPPLGGYDQIARGLAASRISRIGHLLSSRGYRSLFVHGASKTAFRLDRVARSLDFSRYISGDDLAPIHADVGERPPLGWSHEIFEGLARRLDVENAPFVAVALSGWAESPVPDDPLLPSDVLASPRAYADWALAQ